MIVVIARAKIRPEKRDGFLSAAAVCVEKSRAESGNSSGARSSVKAKNQSSDSAGHAARKYSTIDHSVSAAAT